VSNSEVAPAAHLHKALDGKRCVSAWLGHGNVLFLGFDQDVLLERGEDGRRSKPSFELETNFADWSVEGAMTTSSAHSTRADLDAAAESLVGEQVVSWELLKRNGLRVAFTAAKVLTVMPWRAEEGLVDAWSVTSPDGRIVAVATDGRAVVVNATLPVRDWFS